MANTKRRAEYTDRNGNMFMPMNVEGNNWSEHFIDTKKLIFIVTIVVSFVAIITYLNSLHSRVGAYVIWLGTWLFATIYIMRFIIFEEKFYYRMYLELKEHEISTPALFWDIASIKDTDEGAIMTYSDARIAIMVKVDRDTITGKNKEFKETHYDAISDFYKEVISSRYSFVQMNVMEQAGKDPRLNELSKIVYKSSNPAINKLMEIQVGHIKNITRSSLYESDYFLFYTQDLSRIDNIINDISECLFRLLDGAYISYKVLSGRDIVDFIKEEYGVNYFNSAEASLLMFNRYSQNIINPFNITGILWTDGENQKLNDKEINKLKQITSDVVHNTRKQKDVSIKEAIYRKEIKNKIGIDFDKLSDTPEALMEKKKKEKQLKQAKQVKTRQQQLQNRATQQTKNTQQQQNLKQQEQNSWEQQDWDNTQEQDSWDDLDNWNDSNSDLDFSDFDNEFNSNSGVTNIQNTQNIQNTSSNEDEEYIDL